MSVNKIPAIRLWESELPEKWDNIRNGDKIVPKKGAYKDLALKVVYKLHRNGSKLVFCDRIK